jgi:hypothetical protein
MSQNDLVIANDTAANVRADINLALQALASSSSGATAPATTYANMLFYNTASNILQMRSEADDAWIDLGTLDQTANTFSAKVNPLDTSVWETGTGTTEAVISPAKLAAGIAALAGGSGGLTSVQTLTATGTYTRPAGITKVMFFITGGGAGGGDSSLELGQSGATAIKFLDVTSISTSTIVIGAGGTGNTINGNDGGDSSWSDGTNTITADGGNSASTATNASGGDLNISGGAGSFWGGTGMTNNGTPQTTNVFGAGGAGNSDASGSGGNGKSGVLFVMEFS